MLSSLRLAWRRATTIYQRRSVRLATAVIIPIMLTIVLGAAMPREVSPDPRHSMVRLQLCGDPERAAQILSDWRENRRVDEAFANLRDDNRYILIYCSIGVALALGSLSCFRLPHHRAQAGKLVAPAIFCTLLAGGIDRWVENPLLDSLVRCTLRANVAPFSLHELRQLDLVRSFAIAKFALIAFGFSSNVALYLAACRVWIGRESPRRGAPIEFETLLAAEYRSIHGDAAEDASTVDQVPGAPAHKRFEVPSQVEEPYASKVPRDFLGIALSGGGIRSSTFALGVLMRLREFGLLQHADYLSTVSGGGYVGGWLTRLRKSNPAATQTPPRTSQVVEPPEIRHLRVFSNFLVPRTGFLQKEMWLAVAAVVSSFIPALLIGVAVVLASQITWLLVLYATTGPALPPYGGAILVAMLAAVIVGCAASRAGRSDRRAPRRFRLTLVVLVALTTFLSQWWILGSAPSNDAITGGEGTASKVRRIENSSWRRWAELVGYREKGDGARPAVLASGHWEASGGVDVKLSYSVSTPAAAPAFPVSWRVSAVGVSLLVGALLLVGLRLLLSGIRDSKLATSGDRRHAARLRSLDGALGALLLVGASWCVATGLWCVAVAIQRWSEQGWSVPLVGSVSSASLFAWLRDRLRSMLRTEQSGNRWSALQAYVPMLLAYAALVLFYVGVAAILVHLGENNSPNWVLLLIGACSMLAAATGLPTERFGLHEFYRSRITRAFLGGGHFQSEGQVLRDTDESRNDDLRLSQLPTGRPYHLVCCAANDVAGDSLRNQNRGACSATISRAGLTIGGLTRADRRFRFSSALTASAAAFNSQMGGNSVAFGPAVAFLMCALNLRLGLWARHPDAKADKDTILPGSLRFREMFNQTHADASRSPYVHLSDGGHFENLALYELVRRRCRYIIVSDAGADPNVKFEDFGNAVRRIREDFGADIEIDLEPLRPDAQGLSRQHVAVGTIRYDAGGDDFDVGVLVYLKPAITGDEAVDIANYKSLNPAFPHETTVDQFYDEAQWESYRSLGSHAAFQAFSFLDGKRIEPNQTERIATVFSDVRRKWYPTPAGFDAKMIELNGRFVALEQRFAREASDEFMREIYPELAKIEPTTNGTPPRPGAGRNVHLILEMLQLIEDVWLLGDFERNYNHPLMQGWINAFNRWTNSPIVRRWWPFLIPLFTPGMKHFAEEHFGVPRAWAPASDSPHSIDMFVRPTPAFPLPLNLPPQTEPGDELFYIHIAVPESRDEVVPIGWINVKFKNQGGVPVATWRSSHFGMRPGMWSSGFASSFLRKIVDTGVIGRHAVGMLEVRIDLQDGTTYAGRGTGHRRERNDLVMFYKALGFETTDAGEKWITMRRQMTWTPIAPYAPR